MHRILAFIIVLTAAMCLPPDLSAQHTEKWSGEYIYYGTLGETPDMAKQKALERAQIKAVEEVFGLNISQTNLTSVTNTNGESNIDFTSIGGSDVNGEWIETIGEPEYAMSIEGGFIVIKVKLSGRVRKIISTPVDFSARLLRNGVEDKFEDNDFKEGDDLYMSFSSAVNGYLAVYLLDNDGEAYCLLPYSNMENGIFTTKANLRYIFFSRKYANGLPPSFVDELYLTCNENIEHNQIYIIFSPNKFTKVNDVSGVSDSSPEVVLPRHLDNKSFHKWLTSCRKRDNEMRVDKRLITIRK